MLIIAVLFSLTACQNSYKSIENGVIVKVKRTSTQQAQNVRVQVISDKIFRVSAVPSGDFIDKESLSVLKSDAVFKNWKLEEKGDTLFIATATTVARISLQNGQISFTDLRGKIILSEAQQGRMLVDTTVDGTKALAFRQIFDGSDDEGLYGLGQHQSEEMNYKGKNEVLFQYNTKVSFPFIMSTKSYGILWDNYSLTRYGNPNEYKPISALKLYDNNGKAGGLTARYYENGDTSIVFFNQTESSINYENLETVKTIPEGFKLKGSLVTWDGSFEARESGLFNFGFYYAGYVKLWIDGKLMLDHWRTAWNPNLAKFGLNLKTGEKHSVKIKWLPDGDVSYIGFRVLTPIDPVEQNRISFTSEMGDQLDYYFINGSSMDDVISGYRLLTGKSQVMPKWSMGFWQSRQRYKTQDEIVSTLQEFRKRHIPIDNIVLDWFYWREDDWGSHKFDPQRFPNPKAMTDAVHQMNGHIMISVWPKFYHTTEHYKEFEKIGAMYLQATRDSIHDWVGKGYVGSFYDAYNPVARKLFWEQMYDHFNGLGFDAWWMDASEPDIQSNATIEYRKKLMNPTALGPSTQYFNAYALMNARSIYEGWREAYPNQRIFMLTRSGFPGLQRYGAATWSGDIATRWEDMKAQITAGLNYCMSGNPYWTMDIGGFCVENRYIIAKEGSADLDEWRELNTRWIQFGTFAPLFRAHGEFPYREVFNLAPEKHPAYKTIVYYDKLRYRLMPYIYSLAGMTWKNDYTIMRGLAMDFTGDRKVWDIGDQYMFGPALMVCPVYTYKQRERVVYFPEGHGWYDFYTGKYIQGGQTISVSAPYERMPLFVKAGSIIPVGPEIEYAGQSAEPITLYIYTGANAAFNLYEDDGISYDYEKGAHSIIPISYTESTGKLIIGEYQGSFNGMIKDRTFHVIWVKKDKPAGFDGNKKPDATIRYYGKSIIL